MWRRGRYRAAKHADVHQKRADATTPPLAAAAPKAVNKQPVGLHVLAESKDLARDWLS